MFTRRFPVVIRKVDTLRVNRRFFQKGGGGGGIEGLAERLRML